MRIWIDLGNSPHVPLFTALAENFSAAGHEILWTARDYAQTVDLAAAAGLEAKVIGSHGGKNIAAKGFRFAGRVTGLVRWARNKSIDLAVTHNSHEPLLAARLLRIPSVTMMDYEFHPANHLSFRLADLVIVPESFPEKDVARFGARRKAVRYPGIKEEIYLPPGEMHTGIRSELEEIGVGRDDILVVIRPQADEALYNRGFENTLVDEAIGQFSREAGVKVLVLPRTPSQKSRIRAQHGSENVVFPLRVLDSAALLRAADLVISGGGTMNREAAALGTPVVTLFTGRQAAVDEYLAREGRLRKISDVSQLRVITVKRKARADLPAGNPGLRKQVADMILSAAGN